MNTTTLVFLYADFCEEGQYPLEPTADGFVKLVTGSFFLTVFLAYVVSKGYSMEKIEEWEKETFLQEDAERFFQDVENAIEQVNM